MFRMVCIRAKQNLVGRMTYQLQNGLGERIKKEKTTMKTGCVELQKGPPVKQAQQHIGISHKPLISFGMRQHYLHAFQLCLEIDVLGKGNVHIEGDFQQKRTFVALVNSASAFWCFLNDFPKLAVSTIFHTRNQLKRYLLLFKPYAQFDKSLVTPAQLFPQNAMVAVGGRDDMGNSVLNALAGQLKGLLHILGTIIYPWQYMAMKINHGRTT